MAHVKKLCNRNRVLPKKLGLSSCFALSFYMSQNFGISMTLLCEFCMPSFSIGCPKIQKNCHFTDGYEFPNYSPQNDSTRLTSSLLPTTNGVRS